MKYPSSRQLNEMFERHMVIFSDHARPEDWAAAWDELFPLLNAFPQPPLFNRLRNSANRWLNKKIGESTVEIESLNDLHDRWLTGLTSHPQHLSAFFDATRRHQRKLPFPAINQSNARILHWLFSVTAAASNNPKLFIEVWELLLGSMDIFPTDPDEQKLDFRNMMIQTCRPELYFKSSVVEDFCHLHRPYSEKEALDFRKDLIEVMAFRVVASSIENEIDGLLLESSKLNPSYGTVLNEQLMMRLLTQVADGMHRGFDDNGAAVYSTLTSIFRHACDHRPDKTFLLPVTCIAHLNAGLKTVKGCTPAMAAILPLLIKEGFIPDADILKKFYVDFQHYPHSILPQQGVAITSIMFELLKAGVPLPEDMKADWHPIISTGVQKFLYFQAQQAEEQELAALASSLRPQSSGASSKAISAAPPSAHATIASPSSAEAPIAASASDSAPAPRPAGQRRRV